MNLLSNNYVWFLPSRTASRETVATITYNGFSILPFGKEDNLNFSHKIELIKGYENYPAIINTRNPYLRVFANWKLRQIINLDLPNHIIFINFKNTINFLSFPGKYAFNSPIMLNNINTETFADWCKKNLWVDYVPDINYAHIVRFENYKEDLLKIPFITKLPPTLKHKQDEAYIKKYIALHIITSIINNSFDKMYYINFIDKWNLVNSPLPGNAKQWSELRAGILKYDTNHINFIKHSFKFTENSTGNLIDANIIFNSDWKQFYNQDLADWVYNKMKSWFIKFDYDKDSWKQ